MANAFGELLKQCRQKANLSQRKLADEVGVKDPYIVRLEKGQQLPSSKIAVKLSFFFNNIEFLREYIKGNIKNLLLDDLYISFSPLTPNKKPTTNQLASFLEETDASKKMEIISSLDFFLDNGSVAKSRIPTKQFKKIAHLFIDKKKDFLVFKPDITENEITQCKTTEKVKAILQQGHNIQASTSLDVSEHFKNFEIISEVVSVISKQLPSPKTLFDDIKNPKTNISLNKKIERYLHSIDIQVEAGTQFWTDEEFFGTFSVKSKKSLSECEREIRRCYLAAGKEKVEIIINYNQPLAPNQGEKLYDLFKKTLNKKKY